jgi:adenylosuccinate lyase
MGLSTAPVSTQIIQRDRHSEFINALAVCGCSLEKFATEIRHLQKTEVLEAEEFFSKGQKGSSAMPHKRNPVNCERISGLARLLRANAIAAMENVALWHERDISHSSVERVIIPDSCITLDFMISEMIKIIDNLLVYPEKMQKNLDITKGLIFSQDVLLALTKAGMNREDAYRIVQKNAMEVWQSEKTFLELLEADSSVSTLIPSAELKKLFDPKESLKHIDTIFKRVGLE